MKKIVLTALSLALAAPAFAQEISEGMVAQELQTLKQETKAKYSHWTVGLYGGIPLTIGGDMVTFAHDKFHLGYMGGLKVGYMFNPVVGLSLSGQYGKGLTGAKEWERNYILKPSGQTHYGPNVPADASTFDKITSDLTHMIGGLHLDLNLAPLFYGAPTRKVAFILSPAVYLQAFKADVLKDGKQFVPKAIDNKPGLGVGGDVDFRIRASRLIDINLTGGAAWITNNSFDGVDNTGTDNKFGIFGQVGLGLTFKLGNTGEKLDNVAYAPCASHLRGVAMDRVVQRLEAERIAREKAEAERIAREKAEADRLARERAAAEERARQEALATPAAISVPELPTVHFVRGSYRIDTRKYATELETIVRVLNEYSTVAFDILGYCDHTGGEALNDRLAQQRAEELIKYLAGKGVDVSRLTPKGIGKDPQLTGQEALSIKARRVSVKH